ncbi:hypothetical protein [Curtobacterium flaccumfaciens]|uniref:hypothetical protein n=1 Tax=Curtobacterium flaccumfaciens TaxID=2035 RepID=UPI001ADB4549|nr:hypothetical protein [Curtobacterium flaccumfaciens]MBO9038909.1 hypothetical protein [Curtobacterium flaccumfaciens pv. flaccumfaciens]
MRLVTNYHFWYVITWSSCLVAYSWGWSALNEPLRPDLLAFFAITIMISALILVFQTGLRRGEDDRARVQSSSRTGWADGRRLTVLFVVGFGIDFAYQGAVPFLRGEYSGFDITAQVQSTVGVPVLHVVLIAGSIFFALDRADRFFAERSGSLAVQFFVIQALLLLNNSRGYITFCLIGALLIFTARRFSVGGRIRLRVLVLGAIGAVGMLFGIGAFGNVRSGSAWWDSSHITHIGRYQDSYPEWLSAQFQWAYTYFTSPLAGLNLNLSMKPSDGSWLETALMFLPDTFGKYLVADRIDVVYQVSYLNATTGYVVPYYLAGGIVGLYLCYGAQIILLEVGAIIARRTGTAVVLYNVCACVLVIVFVFYNSYADTATCFLLPLALLAGLSRRRRLRRSSGRVIAGVRGLLVPGVESLHRAASEPGSARRRAGSWL